MVYMNLEIKKMAKELHRAFTKKGRKIFYITMGKLNIITKEKRKK